MGGVALGARGVGSGAVVGAMTFTHLYWSKESDPDKPMEMNPATKEQLENLEIDRDEKGFITAVRLRKEKPAPSAHPAPPPAATDPSTT